jgi:hypothetical protein
VGLEMVIPPVEETWLWILNELQPPLNPMEFWSTDVAIGSKFEFKMMKV